MSKENEEISNKIEESKEENAEDNNEENPSEESSKGKDEKKKTVRYEVVVEAPKTRLITAIVMLTGGLLVAVYTGFQDYDVSTWLYILLISLIVFLIAGLLLEWMVVHFLNLNNAKDSAIAAQEEAIAQREADELAAAEAAEQERLEALAREAEAAEAEDETMQGNQPNEYDAFGESDEFDEI